MPSLTVRHITHLTVTYFNFLLGPFNLIEVENGVKSLNNTSREDAEHALMQRQAWMDKLSGVLRSLDEIEASTHTAAKPPQEVESIRSNTALNTGIDVGMGMMVQDKAAAMIRRAARAKAVRLMNELGDA